MEVSDFGGEVHLQSPAIVACVCFSAVGSTTYTKDFSVKHDWIFITNPSKIVGDPSYPSHSVFCLMKPGKRRTSKPEPPGYQIASVLRQSGCWSAGDTATCPQTFIGSACSGTKGRHSVEFCLTLSDVLSFGFFMLAGTVARLTLKGKSITLGVQQIISHFLYWFSLWLTDSICLF